MKSWIRFLLIYVLYLLHFVRHQLTDDVSLFISFNIGDVQNISSRHCLCGSNRLVHSRRGTSSLTSSSDALNSRTLASLWSSTRTDPSWSSARWTGTSICRAAEPFCPSKYFVTRPSVSQDKHDEVDLTGSRGWQRTDHWSVLSRGLDEPSFLVEVFLLPSLRVLCIPLDYVLYNKSRWRWIHPVSRTDRRARHWAVILLFHSDPLCVQICLYPQCSVHQRCTKSCTRHMTSWHWEQPIRWPPDGDVVST